MELLKWARYSYQACRVFPYLQYLITMLPALALLIYHGRLEISPWLLAYVVPFIFADAAGFTYNTICDAAKDPKGKNPIARGDLPVNAAFVNLSILLALSALSFLLIYRSPIAIVLFLLYLLAWLAYSGLRVRLKESLLAPPVASAVLWAGPPLILMAEFGDFGIEGALLLAGLFLAYAAHEVKHTVMDHDDDKAHDCRTFAVIVGKKAAIYAEYAALAAGYALLLACIYISPPAADPLYLVAFIAIFGATLAITMLYGVKTKYTYSRDVFYVTAPYVATKVFIIFYGFAVLAIPGLLIVFIIWIYLMGRYP